LTRISDRWPLRSLDSDTTVFFAHPIPWWALAALFLLAAALAIVAYSRGRVPLAGWPRATLTALRFATLVLLVIFLLRPVLPLPPPPGGSGVVAVLVDTSRSMGLADGGVTRLVQAQALVRDAIVPALSGHFTVEVLSAGERVQRADLAALSADARRTDLPGAIAATRDRYRDRNLAGVVVISDGGNRVPIEHASHAPLDSAPIITVGVGDPQIRYDREVRSVTAGPSAMDASLVDLTATIVGHGATGRSHVRLLQGSRLLEVREVALPADGAPMQVVFPVQPERDAPAVFGVEVTSDARELTAANNRIDVLVPAPGRPRRILFVEGAPGFEHTFLRRAWQLDPSLEVDSVVKKGRDDQGQDTYYVQAASSRTAALSAGFPASREALFAYDAIVLANADLDALSRDALEQLADFVGERGGGLLVIGARALSPQGLAQSTLERVLPVDLTDRRGGLARAALPPAARFKVSLTDEGTRHPVTRLGAADSETRRRWTALPALVGAAALGGPRPGASVLAVTQGSTGATVPLIAVQRFGRGRALIFGGEGSWHWKMRMPSTDRTYESFWRQAARWLAAEAPGPVSVASPLAPALGATATIDISVRNALYEPVPDADVRVSLRDPDGVARDVPSTAAGANSGGHTAAFVPEESGLYRVTVEARRGDVVLGSVEQPVLAGGSDPEFVDPRLNETVLRTLAEASGGRYLAASHARDVADALRARRALTRPSEVRDLWHNAWSFLLIVALLATEWVLRRRWGLR
jgi:uncharacterized membrane protein